MTYAFAAAGTGGHVYPALAVADALVRRGVRPDDVVFFGGDRMEASVVPEHGYSFVAVRIHGLRRALAADNLRLPSALWRATRRIATELRQRGTKVMTAFGGYVSVPAAWAAHRCGAQLFVHEQNAVPGMANRIIAGRADASFVAFAETGRKLRHARVVGNPLRPELAAFDRAALRPQACARYQLGGERPVLGVLGGSLGARVLNEVTARIADAHDPDQIDIVHLTGHAHHESVAQRAALSEVRWCALPFEERMDLFYAVSDVVLSRAGALTISELAATGTPAVVVPLDSVSQRPNAATLERVGGVVVVLESDLDRVAVELGQLLADEPRRAAMARAAASQGRPEAADDMAVALLEAAG